MGERPGLALAACAFAALACDRRLDEALEVGLLDEPVERGAIVAPAGPLAPGTQIIVCTRLLLMPRARCDGWAKATPAGTITGSQLYSVVRMQARLDRVRRMNALRLGPGADANIHFQNAAVIESDHVDAAPYVIRDSNGHLLLFLDATAN